MGFDFTNITMPMAALIASLIGASATITAALIQLRIAWKKELQARAEHKPVSKKAKQGPVRAVLVLSLASAVGGFALSQYLVSDNKARAAKLEAELQARIETLSQSAQRLEHISALGKDGLLQELRQEYARQLGREGVVAVGAVGQCVRSRTEDAATNLCREQDALHYQLCAEIPVAASVTGIDLFARSDVQPWQQHRVQAGRDFGDGRFDAKPFTQSINDTTRQVCHELRYWGGELLQLRMVVHYEPSVTVQDAGSRVAASAGTP